MNTENSTLILFVVVLIIYFASFWRSVLDAVFANSKKRMKLFTVTATVLAVSVSLMALMMNSPDKLYDASSMIRMIVLFSFIGCGILATVSTFGLLAVIFADRESLPGRH